MLESFITKFMISIIGIPIIIALLIKVKFMDDDFAAGKRETLKYGAEETDEIHSKNKILYIILLILSIVFYALYMWFL